MLIEYDPYAKRMDVATYNYYGVLLEMMAESMYVLGIASLPYSLRPQVDENIFQGGAYFV